MTTDVLPRGLRVLLALALLLAPTGARAGAQAVDARAQAREAGAATKRGNVAIRKGAFDDAVKQFEAALASAPDSPDAKLGLTWAYVKLRMFGEASRTAADVIKASPQNTRALALLGVALMRSGYLVKA